MHILLPQSNNPSNKQQLFPVLTKPDRHLIHKGSVDLTLAEEAFDIPTEVIAKDDQGKCIRNLFLADFDPEKPKNNSKLWRAELIRFVKSLIQEGYSPIRHNNLGDLSSSKNHDFAGKKALLKTLHGVGVKEV